MCHSDDGNVKGNYGHHKNSGEVLKEETYKPSAASFRLFLVQTSWGKGLFE